MKRTWPAKTGKHSEHQAPLDKLVPCNSLEEFLRLVRHARPRESSQFYEGGTRIEDCSAMFHAIVAEPSRFWYDHRRLPGDMYRCTSRLERSVTFVAPAILYVADKDSAHVIAVTHCVRDPAGRRHFRVTDTNGEPGTAQTASVVLLQHGVHRQHVWLISDHSPLLPSRILRPDPPQRGLARAGALRVILAARVRWRR